MWTNLLMLLIGVIRRFSGTAHENLVSAVGDDGSTLVPAEAALVVVAIKLADPPVTRLRLMTLTTSACPPSGAPSEPALLSVSRELLHLIIIITTTAPVTAGAKSISTGQRSTLMRRYSDLFNTTQSVCVCVCSQESRLTLVDIYYSSTVRSTGCTCRVSAHS